MTGLSSPNCIRTSATISGVWILPAKLISGFVGGMTKKMR